MGTRIIYKNTNKYFIAHAVGYTGRVGCVNTYFSKVAEPYILTASAGHGGFSAKGLTSTIKNNLVITRKIPKIEIF